MTDQRASATGLHPACPFAAHASYRIDLHPELAEFESFFGTASVPKYVSTTGDWHYDIRRFDFSSGEDHVVCRFAPADGAISFDYSVAGTARWNIALVGLSSLDVETSAGNLLLVGRVKVATLEQFFKLRISPKVNFSLGSIEVLVP